MDIRDVVLGAVLLATSTTGAAQVSGTPTSGGCISVADVHAKVTVEGRLTVGAFTDEDYPEEQAFLIELPKAACIDDGDDFADPEEWFSRVHVSATSDELLAALKAGVGRPIKVSGEGFAAHTRHHRAPLVVLADEVTVR